MKLKTKFLLFLSLSLVASLGLFVLLTLKTYAQDKISFMKEKALQEIVSQAKHLGDYAEIQKEGFLYSDQTKSLFEKEDLSDKFLIDKKGLVVLGPSASLGKPIVDIFGDEILQKINLTKFASGLVEIDSSLKEKILVAYASVPQADYLTLQIYKVDSLSRFVILFLIKVTFAFLAIGAFFLLLGYFAANEFTKSLGKLALSADQFGAGNFEHRAEVDGSDEVANLTEHFNKMAGKIQSSLKMESEKARLQLELETAQKVQETLFLPGEFKKDSVSLTGVYEPASECGGDWWYYFEKGSDIWVAIGDVTGHGVGSAMLTSSVRSAFSMIEKQESLTPAKILTQLNQVVFETMGGKLNMTFCVLQISAQAKKITYANASHEFPMLMKKFESLKKNDIVFMTDSNGPRLGQGKDSAYQDIEVPYEGPQRLVLFSDGIYDVENKAHEAYGERRFLKTVLASNKKSQTSKVMMNELMHDLKTHRQKTVLIDDVSMMIVDLD